MNENSIEIVNAKRERERSTELYVDGDEKSTKSYTRNVKKKKKTKLCAVCTMMRTNPGRQFRISIIWLFCWLLVCRKQYNIHSISSSIKRRKRVNWVKIGWNDGMAKGKLIGFLFLLYIYIYLVFLLLFLLWVCLCCFPFFSSLFVFAIRLPFSYFVWVTKRLACFYTWIKIDDFPVPSARCVYLWLAAQHQNILLSIRFLLLLLRCWFSAQFFCCC